MARLDHFKEPMRSHLANLPCPTFPTTPWANGPNLSKRRVALISTAGLHRRGNRPFESMTGDFRLIPGDIPAGDLVMTHISTNFDRTGFQQDWNVMFPLDRLHELAGEGVIGSVGDFHYSFMGAVDPVAMEQEVRTLAGIIKKDSVDALLLLPV